MFQPPKSRQRLGLWIKIRANVVGGILGSGSGPLNPFET